MKLQGKTFDGPNEEFLVIPRKGQDLIFKARAVLDYEEFNRLVQKPKPPKAIKPGGEAQLLTTDAGYLQQLDAWATAQTNYLILKSLEATPDLEWETVKMDDPSTWDNWRSELDKAFFTDREKTRIVNLVWAANGIDDEKLEEARKRFLAGQAAQE